MQKCDGTTDCPKLATEPDAWDERDCPRPIDCHAPAFLCGDKQTCLDESQVCDGVSDCPMTEISGGGEEEEGCDEGSAECQEGERSSLNHFLCLENNSPTKIAFCSKPLNYKAQFRFLN